MKAFGSIVARVLPGEPATQRECVTQYYCWVKTTRSDLRQGRKGPVSHFGSGDRLAGTLGWLGQPGAFLLGVLQTSLWVEKTGRFNCPDQRSPAGGPQTTGGP